MEPLVSVVIPLYNKEKSITRTVNSVLKQTEQNFEIIIVNDGSTDYSAQAIGNINARGKLKLINQENRGASVARNRGIQEARSDLIAFLDADDEWLPEYLETILALRAQFPEAEVYGTSHYKKDIHSDMTLPNYSFAFYEGWKGIIENYFEVNLKHPLLQTSCVAATRHILKKVGGFPVGVKYGEDTETFIRLSLATKIAFYNKPLVIYHLDAENRTLKRKRDPSEELHKVETLRQLLDCGAVPEPLRPSAFEHLVKYQLRYAKIFLELGNVKSAKVLIQSSKGTKKFISKWYWLSFCAAIPTFLYLPFVKLNKQSQALRRKIIMLRQATRQKIKK